MIEAGLSNGQWMSQFNGRLICGTGLSQSGTPWRLLRARR